MAQGFGFGPGFIKGGTRPWFKHARYAGMTAVGDLNNDRYALTQVPLADVPTASVADLTKLRSATRDEFFAAFLASSTLARTYTDRAGAIKNDLAANQPRFDWSSGKRRFRLEYSSTNLLLNSDTLVTQSYTTTATVYTLSFYGTGTVTLSGAYAGTLTGTGANDRVRLTFTSTAASLTLTPSGDVRKAQLENQSFASNYIPTADVAVTRAIETFRLSPLVEALAQRSEGAILVRGQLDAVGGDRRIIGSNGDTYHTLLYANGDATLNSYVGLLALPQTLNANELTSPFGVVGAWTATSRRITANGRVPVGDAEGGGDRTTLYLGRSEWVDATSFGSGEYDIICVLAESPTDARMQELAVAEVGAA